MFHARASRGEFKASVRLGSAWATLLSTSQASSSSFKLQADRNTLPDSTAMDPKQRNAAALRKRLNDLTGTFIQEYRTIMQRAREDVDSDYSQSAQKELAIKEGAMAIVTTAQNMSMLIRDLQELWLFGSLDTLADAADEEVDRAKALEIAGLIEELAKKMPEVAKVPDEKAQEGYDCET